jgi:hypothetical protein
VSPAGSRPVLAALLLGAGCAGSAPGAAAPRPAGRAGWHLHTVGALSFEAPADWEASGDGRRLALVPPGRSARVEAWVGPRRGADARACLAEAQASLQERDAGLERVQRHPSTLGGQAALVQEADQGASHGWAYVACAGTAPHWLTFIGRSPVSQPLLEDWRALIQTARLGGGT